MTTIIVFFSVIINLLAILAIVILYIRQNHLLNIEKSQKQTMKEMENIFSSYIAEMKEENEQFILKMENARKREHGSKSLSDDIKLENLSPLREAKNQKSADVPNDSYTRLYAAKSYQNIMEPSSDKCKMGSALNLDEDNEVESNDPQSKPFEDQVIFLHNKGLTVDEIAQNLNKGKTEIELLLKFRLKK